MGGGTFFKVGVPVPDLPIGYIGLSLGPQDLRGPQDLKGPPANCGTPEVNCRCKISLYVCQQFMSIHEN